MLVLAIVDSEVLEQGNGAVKQRRVIGNRSQDANDLRPVDILLAVKPWEPRGGLLEKRKRERRIDRRNIGEQRLAQVVEVSDLLKQPFFAKPLRNQRSRVLVAVQVSDAFRKRARASVRTRC